MRVVLSHFAMHTFRSKCSSFHVYGSYHGDEALIVTMSGTEREARPSDYPFVGG